VRHADRACLGNYKNQLLQKFLGIYAVFLLVRRIDNCRLAKMMQIE